MMSRSWFAIGVVALTVAVLHAAWFIAPHADGSLLFCPDNTFRDVEVYGQIRRGQLPLQGPSTSVGGAHGYLAYWLFGFWLTLWPSALSLITLDALVIAATLVAMFALTRELASPAASWLAIALIPATNLAVLVYYPNHILFLPLAASLAALAWLRLDRGGVWPWLLSLSLVLAIGSHSIGWVMLIAAAIADLRQGRVWLRNPVVLVPILIYAIPEGFTTVLGNPEGPLAERSWWDAFRERRPLDVFRSLPFLHIDDDDPTLTQWVHAFATLVALALSRPRAEQPHPRWASLWWAYVGSYVFFCFWTPDTQYYFPMFALLPAVFARAADRLAARGWSTLAGAALLSLIMVTSADLRSRLDAWLRGPIACHIADDLEIVASLSALGASDREVLERTLFDGETPGQRHLAWLHLGFGEIHAAAEPARCIHIRSAGPSTGAQSTPESWQIQTSEHESCPANLQQYGEDIWYLDLASGTLYRR